MSSSSAQPASAGSNADSNPYQFITLSQSPRQRANRNYNLKLRQQPKHSRMCGFGEKVDRRPLDPPPIIQLEIQNTSFTDENSYLYNPYYFMYASLISPESEEELHLLRDGKTRSTTGSIVSSLYRLKDLDNKDGAFFVFPDLSVRMEGTYRLKFSLFEIINTEIYHCSSICSDVFNVYPAKKFPGMEESTFLSRTFAEQGLKIRIRKELRMRKGRGKKGANDEYDSGDAANKKRSRKKSRRGSADRSDKDSESGYSDEGRSDAAQKRRTGAKGSTDGGDKNGPNQQMYPGYDRGYDPNRPMGMGHHDPRHYHMPHDPTHPYAHYGMSGMPPKIWHGHGDPYQSSMPPHGYPPLPHYDPNVPYPPGPPGHHGGPDQEGGVYPSVYNPGQRPVYPPPPHMYNPRDHDGQMMEWHHRDYRHHGYGAGPGPSTGPYVGGAHGYEDPSPRAAAPTSAQSSGEHSGGAGGPAAGTNVPYYGHHPSVSAVRPSPSAHGGEHSSSHAHGMEKPYPGPPLPHYGAPPGYYGGPYPGSQGQVPPGGMPYPYQGVPLPGMIPPAGGDVLGAPGQTPLRDPQRSSKSVNPEDGGGYLAGQQPQQQATPTNSGRGVGGTLQSNVGPALPLGVPQQPIQPSGAAAGQVSPPPHSHPGAPVASTSRAPEWM